MIVSLSGLIVPTIKAQPPLHAIKGILYVNGEIYNSIPIEVRIDFDGEIFNDTTFPFDGEFNYNVGISEHEDETGNISVFYSGKYRTPVDNASVYIHEGEPVEIQLNLSMVTPANNPPNPPDLVSPANGSKVSSAKLKVKVTDPDDDPMDVSFYNADGDVLIGSTTGISNGSTASKTWSGLTDNKIYSWYAVATDGEFSTQSDTWIFTKTSSGGGGGGTGGGGGGIPIPTNKPPLADASAGEPYLAFIGEEITFDGSDSTDEDGDITNYTWEFGDGEMGYGKNPTHTYESPDNYTVILTVTDDDGATDTDTTNVEIKSANLPPTPPEINGSLEGKINITYEFTVMSIDEDNDNLSYIFDWGDGETDETQFFPSGQNITQTHNWSTPGEYKITVSASDGVAVSQITEFTITIEQEKEPIQEEEDWTWLILLLIIIIIALILIYILSKKKKPEGKKQPPKKPENKSKKTPKKKGKK